MWLLHQMETEHTQVCPHELKSLSCWGVFEWDTPLLPDDLQTAIITTSLPVYQQPFLAGSESL